LGQHHGRRVVRRGGFGLVHGGRRLPGEGAQLRKRNHAVQ